MPIQWIWDTKWRKYYRWDESEREYIYEDGMRLDQDGNEVIRGMHYGISSHANLSYTQGTLRLKYRHWLQHSWRWDLTVLHNAQ